MSSPGETRVVVLTARVELDGREVALVERVTIGGGTQVITVDGVPQDKVHPTFERFHVRLLSQAGRMVPDQLEEAGDWDEACKIGVAYAERVAANATRIADLQEALKDGGG